MTRITAEDAVQALTTAAWTETPGSDEAAGRLLTAVRLALAQHEPDAAGNCRLCSQAAPCPQAQAISDAAGPLPQTRTVIHTVAGAFGADWDLASAVAFVRDADEIAWTRDLLGHDIRPVRGAGARGDARRRGRPVRPR